MTSSVPAMVSLRGASQQGLHETAERGDAKVRVPCPAVNAG